MYYVGYYDDKLICLDPHTEQDAITEINDVTFSTFTTRSPKIINFTDCDTTLALWFYLKDENNAEYFYKTIEKWKSESPEDYLIGLQDTKQDIKFDDDKEAEFDDEFEII